MAVLTPTRSAPDVSETATPAPAAVTTHARSRTSAAATTALVLGVAAAFTVGTGVLAAPGAAIGLLAMLFAFGGIAAARKRHVAGNGAASLGLILGLAALALGILAVMGAVGWLDPAVNNVSRLHAWLEVHAPWAMPEF
jgi:hypothetical protein